MICQTVGHGEFWLGGPAGDDSMWGVMELCGACDPRVGGKLATMTPYVPVLAYHINFCPA